MSLKKFSLSIFFLIFLILVPSVNAISTDSAQIINSNKMNLNIKNQDFMTLLEERRKEASDSFKLKLQQFQTKLQNLKDEGKKTLVQRIQDRIAEMETRRTQSFMTILDKLSSILDRLDQKINDAKANGVDTTSIKLAVASARTAITQARTTVLDQAAKVYISQIGTDSTLKTTVGNTVSLFETDLSSLYKLVITAKQAVVKAVSEAVKAGVGGVKVGKPVDLTPTQTATTTPSISISFTPTASPSGGAKE